MDADDDKKIADAWAEYLSETQHRTGPRYSEVEPWAWARLRGRLGKLKPSRKVKNVAA